MYDTATSAFSYLHGDHLGSAGLATSAAGGLAQSQEYDAWGKVRSGGISLTDINYTGQRLDLSGLLNYNARMYDPTLGRFISADSVVPGTASGSMDGIALKPLTVAFVEYGFINQVNQENQFPAWFQMSKRQKQQAGWQWGPQNPQSLNRYSYVLNNPMKYTDPSGHDTCTSEPGCGGVVINNSNKSIWVVGTVDCDTSCITALVEIPVGKSSKDMGVYDADAIAVGPIEGNAKDGYKVLGFKLVNTETAVVTGSNNSLIITVTNDDPVLTAIMHKMRGIKKNDYQSRLQIWDFLTKRYAPRNKVEP